MVKKLRRAKKPGISTPHAGLGSSISGKVTAPHPTLLAVRKFSGNQSVFGISESMNSAFRPWHLFLLILAAWVNRRQQEIIEFQNAQIQALTNKLGRKRILLTDDQRRVLAVKGKARGRKTLSQLTTIVTPNTILRRHRRLIAAKWDFSDRRAKAQGRPPIHDRVVRLVLRFAKENPTWGYDRIQGALHNLGHRISDTTVGNILKENGIEPAPIRRETTTWKTFLKAHWDSIAAIDFTSVEVWNRNGLTTFYILVAIRLKTRCVEIVGVPENPDGNWVRQMARNLTGYDGFLLGASYLLIDRDTKFLPLRTYMSELTNTKIVLLPPRSPNLNAHLLPNSCCIQWPRPPVEYFDLTSAKSAAPWSPPNPASSLPPPQRHPHYRCLLRRQEKASRPGILEIEVT